MSTKETNISVQGIRIIRIREVMYLTGWSRSTIWRRLKAKENDFPTPIRYGVNVGWYAHEIENWIKNLPRDK